MEETRITVSPLLLLSLLVSSGGCSPDGELSSWTPGESSDGNASCLGLNEEDEASFSDLVNPTKKH